MVMEIADMLERLSDRTAAAYQTSRSGYLVIVTFGSLLSATLLASALDGSPIRGARLVAVCLTGLSGVTAFLVFLTDREAVVDADAIVADSIALGLDEEAVITELRVEYLATVRHNRDLFLVQRNLTVAQLLVSVAAAALSVLSIAGL